MPKSSIFNNDFFILLFLGSNRSLGNIFFYPFKSHDYELITDKTHNPNVNDMSVLSCGSFFVTLALKRWAGLLHFAHNMPILRCTYKVEYRLLDYTDFCSERNDVNHTYIVVTTLICCFC